MIQIHSKLTAYPLGLVSKKKARRRTRRLRVSAACKNGNHAQCSCLNCVCPQCNCRENLRILQL
jgi:hypothetical protein